MSARAAKIGRYKGSMLIDVSNRQWLVGNPKEPCAEVPETLEAPFIKLIETPIALDGCVLLVDGEGPKLAETLSAKLVIQRNGSVSERLWRLVTNQQATGELDAQWLIDMPMHVWDIVRDTVLRCS